MTLWASLTRGIATRSPAADMTVQIVDVPPPSDLEIGEQHKNSTQVDPEYLDDEKVASPPYRPDPYGDEEFAEVKYKVLKWW